MAEEATGDVLDGKATDTKSDASKAETGGEAGKGENGAGKSEDPAKYQVNLPDGWQQGLSEDLKEEPSLKLFKDFPSIVKSLVSAQKMIGKDKVVIPDAKLATKEDWKEFYSKVGLPETAENYEVNIDKALYENGVFEESKIAEFKKVAHDLNILPQQLQGVIDWLGKEGEASAIEIDEARRQSGMEELVKYKKDSGEKFDYFKARANQALKTFGGDEFAAFVKESGLASSVPMIKFLAKVGETLKEDVIVGKAPGGGALLTPSEINQKINTIRGDLSHPYWQGSHPGHKEAIKEMEELYQRLEDSKSA